MPINWNEIAGNVGDITDEQFKNQISSLTRFNDDEIESLINDNGISKQDLAKVISEVKNATKSNTQKSKAIENIGKGVDVLVDIVSKFI